ncbi:hypothetical protein BDP81DRAFT_177133 [Colletotrichum phormii]|uniref:Secreted protein n=1 Tax=Colletotrichum phormii TaxID=359342 RepID=A0AAI9ZZ01_9PEZI|nr:uncharacterized protein BDP81DRAFT_177133 [Colletotrichum phormii]KAK1639434.1 hypothetical protein BDP81DRAFT_177133 [Colletotrichum phormii]
MVYGLAWLCIVYDRIVAMPLFACKKELLGPAPCVAEGRATPHPTTASGRKRDEGVVPWFTGSGREGGGRNSMGDGPWMMGDE